MRANTLVVTQILLALAARGLSQTPAPQAQFRPHFRGAHAAANLSATQGPPFETPASLACIYGLVSTQVPGCPVQGTTELPSGGSGIIAVVNAFDYPNAAEDLTVFSRHFGVPECNSSNPCFHKVFATGTPPAVDPLWASNAAGVIEYSHALAPGATVVLVEAASATTPDLMRGVQVANRIISMSPGGRGQIIMPWGIPEYAGEVACDPFFTTPGVIYVSGNEGAPGFLEYPGTSPFVLTVGGTSSLRDSQGAFIAETASTFWAGGISAVEPRPAFQDAIQSIVQQGRGVPDVAFCSDPARGPELYFDSVPLDNFVGWQFTGNVGFGEAAWAAIVNRAQSGAQSTQAELALLYSGLGDTTKFRDIVRGQAFSVHAKPGWDFLTGIGVAVGLAGK